jgi:hypothetical protein
VSDPAPAPALPDPGAAHEHGPRWFIVLFASTALFAMILLAHNLFLFRDHIYEESDSAANSLLVLKAKRLELLHGHYSRFLFFHPGPGLLYVEAAGEALFYDWLEVVPTPHNGQIIALLLMHALLIGIAVTTVTSATGSTRLGAAATLALLVYFAREGQLGSHWFANVFMVVFLSFLFAAASVASGRTGHLGWLALTGGLSVHCHVCFVAFIVPISLYALFRAWAAGGYRLRSLPAPERRSWALFAAVVGLFVLPIALHTVLHYPGEVGRYLTYTRPPAPVRTSGDVSNFLVRCATNESNLGWPVLVCVAAGALTAVLTFPAPYRKYARQLGVVAMLTSAVMLYYAAKSVDDYKYTYVGRFFGSVVAIGWVLLAMRLSALVRGPVCGTLAVVAGVGIGAWAGYTGWFHNGYHGSPDSFVVAKAIADDPRWADGAPAFTLDENGFVESAAVILQLERSGKRVWVVERGWDFVFTDRYRPDNRDVNARWHIDAVDRPESRSGVRRVLAECNGTSFREMETRVPFGEPIPLGTSGRGVGVLTLRGWYSGPHHDFLLPAARESALFVDLDRCPTPSVRLTLTARALGPVGASGQRVGVSVNDTPVGELVFGSNEHTEERTVTFPSEVLNRRSPVQIDFTFPDAIGYRIRFGPRPPVLYSVQIHGLVLAPVQ